MTTDCSLRASIGSSSHLALSNFGGWDCLTHPGTEGPLPGSRSLAPKHIEAVVAVPFQIGQGKPLKDLHRDLVQPRVVPGLIRLNGQRVEHARKKEIATVVA